MSGQVLQRRHRSCPSDSYFSSSSSFYCSVASVVASGYGYGHGGVGVIGVILIVLVVLVLMGQL